MLPIVVWLVASVIERPSVYSQSSIITPSSGMLNIHQPDHKEDAIIYRAYWTLCLSGFSTQLHSAILGLQGDAKRTMTQLLIKSNPRDNTNLEAYGRFLKTFINQYSCAQLLEFIGSKSQSLFIGNLMVLLCHEPMRDIVVRFCHDIPATLNVKLHNLVFQLLKQLSPDCKTEEAMKNEVDSYNKKVRNDSSTQQFTRMTTTCDLLTEFIHEKRFGTLGWVYVTQLATNEACVQLLLSMVKNELNLLPTMFTNESYSIKVLNSLLQQWQCGCVSNVYNSNIFSDKDSILNTEKQDTTPSLRSEIATSDTETNELAATQVHNQPGRPDSDASTSPSNIYLNSIPGDTHENGNLDEVLKVGQVGHDSLPLIWKSFSNDFSAFSSFLIIPSQKPFAFKHVQLLYLLLPVLNLGCSVIDHKVIESHLMEISLLLVSRFPQSSILHCAISRLFIVALEEHPFVFGQAVLTHRPMDAPLRQHILYGVCFEILVRELNKIPKVQKDLTAMNTHETNVCKAEQTTSVPTVKSNNICIPPAFVDIAISFDQGIEMLQNTQSLSLSKSHHDLWSKCKAEIVEPIEKVWEEVVIDKSKIRNVLEKNQIKNSSRVDSSAEFMDDKIPLNKVSELILGDEKIPIAKLIVPKSHTVARRGSNKFEPEMLNEIFNPVHEAIGMSEQPKTSEPSAVKETPHLQNISQSPRVAQHKTSLSIQQNTTYRPATLALSSINRPSMDSTGCDSVSSDEGATIDIDAPATNTNRGLASDNTISMASNNGCLGDPKIVCDTELLGIKRSQELSPGTSDIEETTDRNSSKSTVQVPRIESIENIPVNSNISDPNHIQEPNLEKPLRFDTPSNSLDNSSVGNHKLNDVGVESHNGAVPATISQFEEGKEKEKEGVRLLHNVHLKVKARHDSARNNATKRNDIENKNIDMERIVSVHPDLIYEGLEDENEAIRPKFQRQSDDRNRSPKYNRIHPPLPKRRISVQRLLNIDKAMNTRPLPDTEVAQKEDAKSVMPSDYSQTTLLNCKSSSPEFCLPFLNNSKAPSIATLQEKDSKQKLSTPTTLWSKLMTLGAKSHDKKLPPVSDQRRLSRSLGICDFNDFDDEGLLTPVKKSYSHGE